MNIDHGHKNNVFSLPGLKDRVTWEAVIHMNTEEAL